MLTFQNNQGQFFYKRIVLNTSCFQYPGNCMRWNRFFSQAADLVLQLYKKGTSSKKELHHNFFPVNFLKFYLPLCCFRSSHSEVFLRKGVLKICSKFTGEHPCRSAISIKLQSNFIEIVLRQGCSPVNLLHTFRAPFPRNTSDWLLLLFIPLTAYKIFYQHKYFTWRCLVFTTYFCALRICNWVVTKLRSKLCQLSTVRPRFISWVFRFFRNKFFDILSNLSHHCRQTNFSLTKRCMKENEN